MIFDNTVIQQWRGKYVRVSEIYDDKLRSLNWKCDTIFHLSLGCSLVDRVETSRLSRAAKSFERRNEGKKREKKKGNETHGDKIRNDERGPAALTG